MFRSITTPVSLSLLIGLCAFARPQVGRAQQERDSASPGQVPGDLDWRELKASANVGVLELLSAQTRTNYERINTWTATYAIHSEQYLSPAFVADFGKRLPAGSTAALTQEFEILFKVAIDMNSGSVYRESDTTKFRLLTTDARKPVHIPGVSPVDNRSIVTSEHYVYFAPKDPPATYSVLPDHPEAQNKRRARRVSTDEAQAKHHADLMDPRLFFRCSTLSMFWEELDMYVPSIQGKDGAEKQRLAGERLRIDEAAHAGSTWYRIRVLITFPDGRVDTVTSIWSPEAGFNPVSLTFTAKGEDPPRVTKSLVWQWKSVDGIFVPAVVSEVWRPAELGGLNSYKRTAVLKECSLNTPLHPDQFQYAALGLGSGDLIQDEIEQAMFVMGANGRPKRLAAFHQPYVPRSSGRENAWFWLIAAGIGLVALVVAFAWYRRSSASPRVQ